MQQLQQISSDERSSQTGCLSRLHLMRQSLALGAARASEVACEASSLPLTSNQQSLLAC